MSTRFQIWTSEDDSEGTIMPVSGNVPKDVDDRLMILLHEYQVDGDIDNIDDIERALAYSNKWLYDEGEWPSGCHPLDNNPRPL